MSGVSASPLGLASAVASSLGEALLSAAGGSGTATLNVTFSGSATIDVTVALQPVVLHHGLFPSTSLFPSISLSPVVP